MNTMKKIVAFAMIVSMVLGCLVISTSAAEKKEYVKDGLVAWYDATNNNNGTHDVKADLWKDLSGNANHISIASAVSAGQIDWADGALVIKEGGCYLQLPETVVEALEGRAYTIEIVTGNLAYTATNYITLLSSSNDELSVFIRCSATDPNDSEYLGLEYKNQDANGDGNRPQVANAWEKFNGKTLAVTADLDALDENGRDGNRETSETDNVILYSDAVRISSGESEYNMDLDYVYLGHTDVKRAWSGEIYGLRIYDRALSAEEIAKNTEADQWNYRSSQTFAPKQEYDPANDSKYAGFADLSAYTDPTKIIFNQDTDLIPLTGFYGSINLLDYLYPYESEKNPWEGARLMKTEEPDTDYDGSVRSGTAFDILYQSFCSRAGLTPITGAQAQYFVIKLVVEGEFEDMTINTIGFDADINDDMEYSTGSLYGGIDFDKEGEVQYLIYDISTIFDDCEAMMKFSIDISGMTDDTAIYLQEIAFFSTEKEACEYAGEEYEEKTTADETTKAPETTVAPDEETTKAPEVEETTKAPETTEAPKSEGGCGAVVGFGAAAILVAAAAAVVLKKKD